MQPVIVLFEDHTSAGFRPLGWSVPVWELRSGILNLRERLTLAAGRPPVLLPRGYLAELARACGHEAGPEAVQEALIGADRVVWVAARLGADWELLADLLDRCEARRDLAWRDADGLLAASVDGEAGRELLAAWEAWDAAAAASGAWQLTGLPAPRWLPEVTGEEPPPASPGPLPVAWRRLWDLVPATGPAIAADIERLHERGLPARRPWGVRVLAGRQGIWEHASPLAAGGARLDGTHLVRPERIWVGPDTRIAPGVCLDATAGPVVLDRGVRVLPQCYLAGPLYVGAGTLIKAGTRLEGETSIGARCKVAGEVAESTFLDLTNKAHDGFVGHAYLGSWVNLGAMTTCSDLKNNYGSVRADAGLGSEDTGLRFLGLMMGEHAKTAIGTLFNTGTAVGFASNVFGTGFPPKSLPCYTWGDGRDDQRQDTERALATAETVMARRDCLLTDAHRRLFRYLAG